MLSITGKNVSRRTHTHTSILRPFFWDHSGEPVPEENFWTPWCKGRLTEADTPTIQLGVTPSGLTSAHLHHPSIFYRPDALPATQPTVSKRWRENHVQYNDNNTLQFIAFCSINGQRHTTHAQTLYNCRFNYSTDKYKMQTKTSQTNFSFMRW